MTREVERWATTNGLDPKTDGILDRYRTAYEEQRSAVLQELRAQTRDHEGRAAAIGLLNRTGVSDAERLLTLDALDESIGPEDVPPMVATVMNQRSDVVRRAADVLAKVQSAETRFALKKVLGGREDEAGDAARTLADGFAPAPGRPAPRDALFDALASAPDVSLPLEPEVMDSARALDLELQESGRTAQGLSDYQQLIRDELHILALLSDLPADEELGDRARGTLFTRISLARVHQLAPVLPSDVLTQFCLRALSRKQRRGKRQDRAELALLLLAEADAGTRAASSRELRECLAEDAVELRFGAARALASDPTMLDDHDRSAIAEVYSDLPAEWQERLAPNLRDILPDDVVLDVPALVRWVLAAGSDETGDRLEAALKRWHNAKGIDPSGAGQLASSLIELAQRLPDADQRHARVEIADRLSGWLATARSQPRTAIDELLTAPGLPDLICGTFWRSAIARLSRSMAIALLPAAVLSAPEPDQALSVLLAEVSEPREGFRAALPILLGGQLDADHAFSAAPTVGKAELLLARLGTVRDLAADERRLEAAREDATTEALVSHRDTVLSALAAAEQASAGNDHLLRQFRAIRSAVGFVTKPDESGSPDSTVLDWRRETTARLPSALVNHDPAEPLQVNVDAKDSLPDLLRLIEELDRRVHGRGVTAASDRQHHAADLAAVVRGVLELAGNDVPAGLVQLTSRRPELARVVWSIALGQITNPGDALISTLRDQSDPRRAVLQTDILLERASDADLLQVVTALGDEDLAFAWKLSGQLYSHHRHAREAIAAVVERQSETVMENIAGELDLPFRAIDSILFGYFRLRAILKEAGWGQVAESLGDLIRREDLDLRLYEVTATDRADDYVVRSLGISVGDRPVRRAIVEPLSSPQVNEEGYHDG